MFVFFDFVLSILVTVGRFIVSLFQSIVSFFVMVGKSLVYLFDAFSQLPAFVAPFCYLTVAIAIVFLLINRKGSS